MKHYNSGNKEVLEKEKGKEFKHSGINFHCNYECVCVCVYIYV